MIKLIEFLGRLVVRGYRRAAVLERKVERRLPMQRLMLMRWLSSLPSSHWKLA